MAPESAPSRGRHAIAPAIWPRSRSRRARPHEFSDAGQRETVREQLIRFREEFPGELGFGHRAVLKRAQDFDADLDEDGDPEVCRQFWADFECRPFFDLVARLLNILESGSVPE